VEDDDPRRDADRAEARGAARAEVAGRRPGRREARVSRAVAGDVVGTPKSGRAREVPLSPETVKALKQHRHLRGELVFCTDAGRMFRKNETKHPLWRACKRAGLRLIGWHALRHTFASHLTMRGVPLKAIQELLGHATIEMTMRYSHLSPEVRRDAVIMLDRHCNSVATAEGGRASG
jgi:integrase